MHTTREVQTALKAMGFDPGVIDGVMGRNTQAALRSFQKSSGILADGIYGPVTDRYLFPGQLVNTQYVLPPWYELALSKKGLHEDRDWQELYKFLKSDGHTLGDPRELPWCGDFVETCIAITLPNESLPSNPYLARNWQKFGKYIEPTVGAIGVFWRVDRDGTQGHVTFIAGNEGNYLYGLGGNQSNGVSSAKLSYQRLLGCYWPLTFPRPERVWLPIAKGGAISYNEA
jgi:uncharacterized protein (TIGR02594 family)